MSLTLSILVSNRKWLALHWVFLLTQLTKQLMAYMKDRLVAREKTYYAKNQRRKISFLLFLSLFYK